MEYSHRDSDGTIFGKPTPYRGSKVFPPNHMEEMKLGKKAVYNFSFIYLNRFVLLIKDIYMSHGRSVIELKILFFRLKIFFEIFFLFFGSSN
jgi:hypothetical protein